MFGLPPIQPETATDQAAELLADVHRFLGVTPNLALAMANSPAVLKAYLDSAGALRGGELPESIRARIAVLVAQENRCDYGLSAHIHIGTKVTGLTREEMADAREGRASDARASAALALATALLRGRGAVTDADLAVAGAHLTHGEIAEVVANVALNIFTTYLGKAGRVAVDWPLVRHDAP
ncbi:carboxymuconolactone decarboxylase family protein [Nonomuraea sp. NPDC050556]|uniref:carboxymuconolactone decarboxylase family protein n=1 Tax=Nonomuraea sp. NPDC050556 TaxID=3364369 RepID=UPI0037960B57